MRVWMKLTRKRMRVTIVKDASTCAMSPCPDSCQKTSKQVRTRQTMTSQAQYIVSYCLLTFPCLLALDAVLPEDSTVLGFGSRWFWRFYRLAVLFTRPAYYSFYIPIKGTHLLFRLYETSAFFSHNNVHLKTA